jgi:hypothetical protein
MRWRSYAALAAVLLASAVGGSALGSNARSAPIPVPAGVALQAADLPGFTSFTGAGGRAESANCPGPHGVIDHQPAPERCDASGFMVTTAISGPAARK